MTETVADYHDEQTPGDRTVCELLAREIDDALPQAERKIWHGHLVGFLDENPIVGYKKLKDCVRLLFWSGQSFEADGLAPEGSFRVAESRYTHVEDVDVERLRTWLAESRDTQWDYKNVAKRKGELRRIR